MSRKVLENSFPDEEERNTKRKDPPGFVPWSNPTERQATTTHMNPTQGPSTSSHQHVISSSRHHQDASPGAEALSRPGRHPPMFVEETRPGVILVPGIDSDGLTIEEGYNEQATIASHEASTVQVVARVVDMEAENWRLCEADRLYHEQDRIRHALDRACHDRDQACHERDQLRQILENAAVVTPIVTTSRDEENADEKIHANNHDGLPRSEDPKCGTRGWRLFAIGAILVVVVAVVVTLALVLPSEPDPLSELLLSIYSEKLTGTIPTEIGMLSDYLVEIWLYGNGLTGTIPSEVGQLTKLAHLSLSENKLSGTIPSQINSLVNLDDLRLIGNSFTGTYTCPEFINYCRISCNDGYNVECRAL